MKLIYTPEVPIQWKYEEGPCIRIPAGSYGRDIKVDPFPGYAHDAQMALACLKDAAERFPIEQEVFLTVLSYDGIGRTNAQTFNDSFYNKEKDAKGEYPWCGSIILFGKRIPPHPATTRYLVPHEYGHVIARWLQNALDMKYDSDVLKHYAELRRITLEDAPNHGGRWHGSTGEILANDFRILVAEAEKEFWPHPGTARPETCENIVKFWATMSASCKAAAQKEAVTS